ncbi:IS66 family insertion sequence element accessory protein TnpB [Endozoicomonas sp. 8E]|uniref:IS66 family insertion sequence element accessory protein TnpB n=1 Tax=Endozoicomonas sp. 8E TaxID=3035692 RepID=UPI002938EC11|nr:IS66 family insertion sequence element accessory protein TnpB [Endozoicomonas sp. 8E]WOG29907.1 IS66 family insertion sequence element accessory protein TnpB [Endozoicomonas sp. 8E]
MMTANINHPVYLATGVTDMRKSIDGLAVIVSECLALNPLSGSLFVFCNRQRDKIKILHWDGSGFWLYYKRLEKGRFQWPKVSNNESVNLTRQQLNWLLDGLQLEQKQAHRALQYQTVT